MSMVTDVVTEPSFGPKSDPVQQLEKPLEGLNLSEMTLKDLHQNDQLGVDLFVHIREKYQHQDLGEGQHINVEGDLPEKFYIDLSNTQLSEFPIIQTQGTALTRVDISFSEIDSLRGGLLYTSIEECIFQQKADIFALFITTILEQREKFLEEREALGKREIAPLRGFEITRLKVLDLSFSKLKDLFPEKEKRFLRIDKTFVHLEKIFLSGCNIPSFPIDLAMHRRHVRWIDLSNNSIKSLKPADYTMATNGMFCPTAEESYPEEKTEKKSYSISVALQMGLIIESPVRGLYIGKDYPDKALPLHLDLRNNPLDKETRAILKAFPRVNLGTGQGLACLPGGFFVYYTKAKQVMPIAGKV